MPSLKDIRNRINSVKTTQQATRAMKMVSAAKLNRAQNLIVNLRPYANRLADMRELLAGVDNLPELTPLSQERPCEKVLLVVWASNRGLCGPFNQQVLRYGLSVAQGAYADQHAKGQVEILAIGKKAAEFYRRNGFTVHTPEVDLFTPVDFASVDKLTDWLFTSYQNGRWDRIDLVYNEFVNILTQRRRHDGWLPFVPPAQEDASGEALPQGITWSDPGLLLYEPNLRSFLQAWIPKSLKIAFFRALLESNAAEHGARMVAMDAATNNAQNLLKDLRLSYNKARQATITKEILEIVGGANALEEAA